MWSVATTKNLNPPRRRGERRREGQNQRHDQKPRTAECAEEQPRISRKENRRKFAGKTRFRTKNRNPPRRHGERRGEGQNPETRQVLQYGRLEACLGLQASGRAAERISPSLPPQNANTARFEDPGCSRARSHFVAPLRHGAQRKRAFAALGRNGRWLKCGCTRVSDFIEVRLRGVWTPDTCLLQSSVLKHGLVHWV